MCHTRLANDLHMELGAPVEVEPKKNGATKGSVVLSSRNLSQSTGKHYYAMARILPKTLVPPVATIAVGLLSSDAMKVVKS